MTHRILKLLAVTLPLVATVAPVCAAVPETALTVVEVPQSASLAGARFVVVDPATGRVVAGRVTVEAVTDPYPLGALRLPIPRVPSGCPFPTSRSSFQGRGSLISLASSSRGTISELQAPPSLEGGTTGREGAPRGYPGDREAQSARGLGTLIRIPAGTTVVLHQQVSSTQISPTPGQPPIKDIYIKVTATRTATKAQDVTAGGTERSSGQLKTFTAPASNDAGALTRGQSGVASDSNGQQHVRGEHADISFVVDGVPLPDTLSGRQGSVVVPSTIESLDILTGGFAPEFGGQTAAVLDITTLPGSKKTASSLTFSTGNYGTLDTDFSSSGPLGERASYVFDFADDRSNNALEPQQPNEQSAHNGGDDQSYFAKFRVAPTGRDTFSLTVSHAPGHLELSNRTGLGARFASAGQGYGFLGLRNADGTRPDATADNAGALGAATDLLGSQQADGMAISQYELNEFATLSYRHQFDLRDFGQIAGVLLHSQQDVTNSNPTVDLNDLPVDNSVEYNPTSHRSVHHYQVNGDLTGQRGSHTFKGGLLSDQETGDESYQIVPASQLALNELVALSPNLAPDGAVTMGEDGSAVVDVDGNPIFTAAAGATSPTLHVHRSGFYDAAYLQDTWKATSKLTANYGLRYDHYRQGQNLGQPVIDKTAYSPRVNLSYALAPTTIFRTSYDHIFNIPPLAQGAVVGDPIQPETLDQYDASLERKIGHGQTAKIAYYYKEIKNQVDTGLLIPGSQIGLYSAVNFQYGAVHGTEISYDISPPGGVGLDGYLNYSYSFAQPNGLDNTGAPAPQYNDHDQRHTVGAGLAYLWKGGATAAFTLTYGSGLASSPIPPSPERIQRTEVDMHLASNPHLLYGGHGGLGLDVSNLFDDRQVINFQSGFSGTRFVEGRRVLLSTSVNF